MTRAPATEMRRALTDIAAFLAFGSVFLLLGLLTPSVTPLYRALFWQTSTVGFFTAAVVVWRHPVVWYPVARRWYNHLRQKPKPAPRY